MRGHRNQHRKAPAPCLAAPDQLLQNWNHDIKLEGDPKAVQSLAGLLKYKTELEAVQNLAGLLT